MPSDQASGTKRGWGWILQTTFADLQKDQPFRLAASLAYYTLFSLAPLLLIVVAIAGAVFGDQAVMGQVHHQLEGFLGREAALQVEDLIARARGTEASAIASALGILAVMWGASGVFTELRDALNMIWDVKPATYSGWLVFLRDRALSFAMLLCIGFLLLVSLVIETAVSAAQTWAGGHWAWAANHWSVPWINAATSLGIVTVLFALIFRYLPDAKIDWRHIWLGAFVTSILFAIGKWLFGLYLGQGTIGSTYGTAGSVIIILLWAYYSSLILLIGAELTQAHARACSPDSGIREALGGDR